MVSALDLGMGLLVVFVIVAISLLIVPPRAMLRSLRSFERRTGTPPAATLAAGVVGLAVLAVGLAGSDAGGGEFTVVDGIPIVLGAIGPLGVVVGLAARSAAGRLTAATDCRTGSPETGAIAVDGALREVDGTFPLPDADEGALLCAYALQRDRGFAHRSPVWATVAAGERACPMAVDDGSGAVRVDDDATLRTGQHAHRSYSVAIPEGEPAPEAVASFLAAVGVDAPDRPDADHRLSLRPLTPGNTVTAVGEYDRVTTETDAFWGITGGDEPAAVYPGQRDDVRASLARRSKWLVGGGAVLTLVGVGALVAIVLA